MSVAEQIVWSPGTSLEEIERQVIVKAWHFYRQNKSATAQALGISVRTLDTKLEKYGKDDETLKEQVNARKTEREAFLARCRGTHPATHVSGPHTDSRHEPAAGHKPRGIGADDTRAPYSDEPAANQADARNGVESPAQASAKQAVSVPQRAQVQGVPYGQAAAGGNGKRR